MRNYWKPIDNMIKSKILTYLGGPKWPDNQDYETHILQTSKSSSNEHVKQILMWNQWKLFEKTGKDRNFDLFWAPKWSKNRNKNGQQERPIFYTPLK